MTAARPRGGAVSVVGAALVNVSSYGMMIESPVPLEREAVLQFRLMVAGEKTDVGPAVAGEVVEVHVRPGDYVEAGDPLATLDARRAREDLRMTEATLRSEKAALAQAEVDREEAANRLAQTEKLVEVGAASRSAVEDARFEHRRAKANEARVAAVVAQWRTKRAQLERQLADTELRAPFSGHVARRYVDPGATLGTGDCCRNGTEIATRLFSQKKMTGSRWIAAKLRPSWKSPLLTAPSPK